MYALTLNTRRAILEDKNIQQYRCVNLKYQHNVFYYSYYLTGLYIYRVTHRNLTSFECVVLSRLAVGGERGTVPMCGFNKMVPQRTLQTSQ